MTYYDYGLRFKYLRKQRNISLKTAAQVINTSRQRLGKWQGEFRLWRSNSITQISEN